MPKIIDDVINYVKGFQAKGFSVEYEIPENPEYVMVHVPLDRKGVVMVEAKLEILNQIREAIENN